MKVCIGCKIKKNENDFYPKINTCKECKKKYAREYIDNNPAKRKKILQKYKKKHFEVICVQCKNPFYKTRDEDECSIKCKLLNRYKEVNGCWEWQGKIGNSGYGHVGHNKRHWLVHRLSYEVFKKPISKGKIICHTCDNKKCYNPEHLWEGTYTQNMQDCIEKGRKTIAKGWKHTKETKQKFKNRPHSDRRGEKHHLCKLKEDDVLEIRKLLKTKMKRQEIVEKFGISRTYLYDIKSYKAWPHLK